jgi:hypothetical protein
MAEGDEVGCGNISPSWHLKNTEFIIKIKKVKKLISVEKSAGNPVF